MTYDNIILPFGDGNYIAITLPDTKENLYRFDEILITFHGKDKQLYTMRNEFAGPTLESFEIQLNRALSGPRKDLEINKDLGYLWNEDLQEKPASPLNKEGNWEGMWHLLWSQKSTWSFWLYNKNNKIYFEIAPVYPWHFSDPQPGQPYYTYEHFIKHYKPILIVELHKETIEDWLKKIKMLRDIIRFHDLLYNSKEQ